MTTSIPVSSPRVIIPERVFGGYIFDLDGTLVESMPMHHRAWQLALQKNGAPREIFGWGEFVAHGGMAAVDIVKDLNACHSLSMDPSTVAEEKRAQYALLLGEGALDVIPETVNLVRSLRERNIPYAIGTGSFMPGALATLRAAKLEDLFPIIITPEDVPRGKPAPDIFLKAAERMGVNPAECVVFEDAEPGLRAAIAAGMACVRVLPGVQ